MYLQRVILHDIKAFAKADLDLCPDGKHFAGWAVITGDNGSGKTALLRAIALAILGPDQGRNVLPDPVGWVRTDAKAGTASVEVRPHNEYDKTQKGGAPYKSTFWAEIEIALEGKTYVIDQIDIYRKKRKGATNGPWPESTEGWFIVGYGPFRRLYGTSPDAHKIMRSKGRSPGFATLFLEGATLGEAEEWMLDLDHARLDFEFRGRTDKEPEAKTLANLVRLISDDFLRHGIRIDEIESGAIWLRDAAGCRIRLSDMSEGYRAAIAMLVDIYRQMVAVYGPDIVHTNDECGEHVARPGVVMIDEVDAHLHPDWQRDIGFWLQRHFPEVQFVVTTHSPLVCAAANNGRVYHIPEPGAGEPFQLSQEDYQRVLAGRPDEILLTPAFGMRNVRSPKAVDARRRHAVLMSKKHSLGALAPEEEALLEQLTLFVSPAEST